MIYIYQDDGVSGESFRHTMFVMAETLSSKYRIQSINAKEIVNTPWTKNANLLIIPGGADLPYVKKLNGKANQIIKEFVSNGGAYLGICAGGYYGANYVEFNKGRAVEILGSRELSFFPDKSVGPILTEYCCKSQSGAHAARLTLELENSTEALIYSNGGGYFKNAENYPNISVIGRYQLTHGAPAAIVHINYNKGNVILSGVHFEYNPYLLDHKNRYLKKIIPDLIQYDVTRKMLIQIILKKLQL